MALEDTGGRKFTDPEKAISARKEDFSQLGAQLTGARKARRGENWGQVGEVTLIAADVASLGNIGTARMIGQEIKRRRDGPTQRPLTHREEIAYEIKMAEMDRLQKDADAKAAAGEIEAARKAQHEVDKMRVDFLKNTEDNEAQFAGDRLKVQGDRVVQLDKELAGMDKQLSGDAAHFSEKQKSTVNKYSATLLEADQAGYAQSIGEVAEALVGMDPIDALNTIDAIQAATGDNVLTVLSGTTLIGNETKQILDEKLQRGMSQRVEMQATMKRTRAQLDVEEEKLKKIGYRKQQFPDLTGSAGTTEGATGPEALAQGGSSGVDLSRIISKIKDAPDLRPDSQKMFEEARGSEAYASAMTELGLDPLDKIDQKNFEKMSRKASRILRRAKKEALRKGIRLEDTRAFADFDMQLEAGQVNLPRKQLVRQLALMFGGSDMEEWGIQGAMDAEGIAIDPQDRQLGATEGELEAADVPLVQGSNLQHLRQLVGEGQEQMLTSGGEAASSTAIETTEDRTFDPSAPFRGKMASFDRSPGSWLTPKQEEESFAADLNAKAREEQAARAAREASEARAGAAEIKRSGLMGPPKIDRASAKTAGLVKSLTP